MINYCVDYFYVDDDFYEGDTFIFSSNEERQSWIDKADGHYSILDVYENEECYCYACHEGECVCGNFK